MYQQKIHKKLIKKYDMFSSHQKKRHKQREEQHYHQHLHSSELRKTWNATVQRRGNSQRLRNGPWAPRTSMRPASQPWIPTKWSPPGTAKRETELAKSYGTFNGSDVGVWLPVFNDSLKLDVFDNNWKKIYEMLKLFDLFATHLHWTVAYECL